MKMLHDLKEKYYQYTLQKGIPDYLLIHPEDHKELILSINASTFQEPPDFLDVLVVPSESIKFGKYSYARK